jgi:hypothetical protein
MRERFPQVIIKNGCPLFFIIYTIIYIKKESCFIYYIYNRRKLGGMDIVGERRKAMTKKQFSEMAQKAKGVTFGLDEFTKIPYEVGELVRKDRRSVLSERAVMVFIKYQGLCLDGSWDLDLLNEAYQFLRYTTIV